MKRVLAYLFIVLGLGLILNINANAANTKKIDYLCISQNKDNKKEYVKHKNDEYLLQVFYKNKLLNLQKNKNCVYKVFSTDPIFEKFFDIFSDKKIGKKVLVDNSWGLTKKIKQKVFYEEYNHLKSAVNISKRLCVSKSFNSDYRFSDSFCKDSEREIKKGSEEFFEAKAFIEIQNKNSTNSSKSSENKKQTGNYVCSIWQTSTFKIVDYTNDKSRCTDLYYENEDQEQYRIFSRYINNIISNKKYTSLKGSPQEQELLVKQKITNDKNQFKNIVYPFFCIRKYQNWLNVYNPDRKVDCGNHQSITHFQALQKYKGKGYNINNGKYFNLCMTNRYAVTFAPAALNNDDGKGNCRYSDMVRLDYDGKNYFYMSDKKIKHAKLNTDNKKLNEMKTVGNSQVEKLSIDNQKLKFCVDDRVNNRYSPYINTSNSECVGYSKKTNFAKYIEWKFRWNFERISNFQKTEKELFQIVKDNLVSETEKYGLNKSELEKFISNSKYSKFETQIAKAEPSQTQKVTKIEQVKVCLYNDENTILISNKAKSNCKNEDARGSKISYEKLLSKNPNMEICYRPNYKTVFAVKTIQRPGIYDTQTNKNCNQIFEDAVVLNHLSDDNFSTTVKTKDAKLNINDNKELASETKIAKVEEPKQEEFKPKKTNQDKDPPIIEVAENITVSDSVYEIKGNVKDKSKKIFIEVDGQTIPVKKGKFKIKRFSPVDEQIKIVAIDQWGNRSKPKIVNVTIDIKNIEVAEKIEPLNPTKMRSRKNKDRIALIIGIEKYDQIPSASYANLDAKFFYEYARKGFGISKSNIKLLIDEDADLVKSLGTLNKWLPGKIKSGQTELIIFFAGHGLASNDGKELYILPQDSDPDLLDRTALSRTELFKEIINLNPKSVTMFMDTCYSGISRDEKMLLASARPVRIVADEEESIPDNFTIFSASQLDQISSGIKEAKHGIFSYYLMKGLEGYADINKDRNITNGELLAYMDENVSQKASELGRQQNPSLAGDPDRVLISYR